MRKAVGVTFFACVAIALVRAAGATDYNIWQTNELSDAFRRQLGA